MSISEGGAFAKYKTYDFIVPSVHNLATANYASETASQMDATTELIGRIQESCNAYNRVLREPRYTPACKIVFPVMARNEAFLKGLHIDGLQGISARYNQMLIDKSRKGETIIDEYDPDYIPAKQGGATYPGMHYIGFAYDVNSMVSALKSFNLLFGSLLELKQKDI